MRLDLGERTYELTTRALVLADLGGDESEMAAKQALADGADLVELSRAVVLTHDGPGTVEEVRDDLAARARQAMASGTSPAAIVVDPGLERGKTADERGALLRRGSDLAVLGYPVLCTCETPAETAVAVINGCRIVRTRHTKQARRVCDVIAAILEAS